LYLPESLHASSRLAGERFYSWHRYHQRVHL